MSHYVSESWLLSILGSSTIILYPIWIFSTSARLEKVWPLRLLLNLVILFVINYVHVPWSGHFLTIGITLNTNSTRRWSRRLSRCLLTDFRHLLLPFFIKFYVQNIKAFRFGFSVHSLRLRIISLCLYRLVFADFHDALATQLILVIILNNIVCFWNLRVPIGSWNRPNKWVVLLFARIMVRGLSLSIVDRALAIVKTSLNGSTNIFVFDSSHISRMQKYDILGVIIIVCDMVQISFQIGGLMILSIIHLGMWNRLIRHNWTSLRTFSLTHVILIWMSTTNNLLVGILFLCRMWNYVTRVIDMLHLLSWISLVKSTLYFSLVVNITCIIGAFVDDRIGIVTGNHSPRYGSLWSWYRCICTYCLIVDQRLRLIFLDCTLMLIFY